jgi:ATP-dependent protease ClpP protease subunit
MRPGFRASLKDDGTLEMLVYGDIVDTATLSMLEAWGYPTDGFISATAIKKQMDGAGEYSSIALRINSPGGDAFEGIAIHNLVRAQGKPVAVYVDGVAASSASIIAMAGDTITMGGSSMMMIHNAWCDCRGDAAEMRKTADLLDKVSESIGQTYVKRTGKTADEIKALMSAETWMSAQDCLRDGFATQIAEEPDERSAEAMAMARGFKALARMKNVPEALKAGDATRPAPAKNLGAGYGDCECSCDNCAANNCGSCTNADCADKNCQDCPMRASAHTHVSAESDTLLYEDRLMMLRGHTLIKGEL